MSRTEAAAGWRHRAAFFPILAFAVATLGLVAFGLIPLPAPLLESALARFENPLVLLLLGAAFWWAYRLPGWKATFAASCATLAVPGVVLAAVWQAGESDGILVIGGLLPWSDARGYFSGAQLLNGGGELTEWHGSRPWITCLLAVLLWISQGSLQWTIAMLVIMAATAFFLFARVVTASLGAFAAAAALLVLFVFYGPYLATTMSEHLGLALGAVAMAALWQGARPRRLGLSWAAGVWLLTCAMAARPAALLVVPAVVVWGAWHSYRSISKADSIRVLAIGSLAIVAGVALDWVLREVLTPGAVPAGNFSYVLYGLVVGNKGWTQVFQDHPAIQLLGPAEAARTAYQLAFEAFRASPMTAVAGALGAWEQYFSFRGLVGFVSAPYRVVPYALAVLGVAHCLRRRRDPPHSMVLAMTAGLFLSVPFAPPIDSQTMRVYAATIPLFALMVGIGTAGFQRGPADASSEAVSATVAAGYGALVILFAFSGALALHFFIEAEPFSTSACPPGQRSLHLRMKDSAVIHLVDDGPRTHTRMPYVRVSDFRNHARKFGLFYKDLRKILETLEPGHSLRLAIDWGRGRRGEALWLISRGADLPRNGMAHVCARFDSEVEGVPFYHAESATPG